MCCGMACAWRNEPLTAVVVMVGVDEAEAVVEGVCVCAGVVQ